MNRRLLTLLISFSLLFIHCSKKKEALKTPDSASTIRKQEKKNTTTLDNYEKSLQAIQPSDEKTSDSKTALIEIEDKVTKEEATSTEPNENTTYEDPFYSFEQAITIYQEAQDLWLLGKFEETIAKLDEALVKVLAIDTDSNPQLQEEKDQLRLMIAKKIVEIYASQITALPSLDGSIPREINKYVEYEIRSFQGPERKFFLSSYQRSGRYRAMILKMLEEAGMPRELSWLPLIESGYKVRALSKARALGLWQFIASTGYRYGLKRTSWIDERMDPEKSTRAAIAYLKDLHELFGDWLTAIAAYNCGEHNVQRAIRAQRINYLDSFWDLYIHLPRETARYVPRFLATLAIVENPEKYGFQLPNPDPPINFEVVEVERSVSLSLLEKKLGLSPNTLVELNAELRRKATPPFRYKLKVPPNFGQKTVAIIEKLPTYKMASVRTYRVRRGDTLSKIAKKFGVSARTIQRLNRIRNPHRLRIGQKLKIPTSRYRLAKKRSYTEKKVDVSSIKEVKTIVVKAGDSLWSIAQRHNTNVATIIALNKLKSTRLKVGQTLKVPATISRKNVKVSRKANGTIHVVKRGESLFTIAAKYKVPLESLLEANGLSKHSTIYPNQKLLIPNSN